MSPRSSETPLTAARFVERMSAAERARAARVERVLPALRERAAEADATGTFPREHIATLADAGLLGLVVPEEYGGLGGGLRDLAAATYAMGSACPSTALAYFFHCSSASRGLLALEALQAGSFDASEAPSVRAFAEKVLTRMGREGKWLANFASESNKTAKAAVTIATEAERVAGGFLLRGEKSFGCATGVADQYLVTAKLAGTSTADGLALFFVERDAKGVRERARWNAVGMRGSATHGLTLEDVFVADDEALALPGAFVKMMQMSRGSFVGNQLAGTACYLGAAQAVYDAAIERVRAQKFADTAESLATSPMHQELIGKMTVDLETGYLWLRRQLELEASEATLLPKDRVVMQWRLCKGEVAEACFRVAQSALKMCGTSGTDNGLVFARALRDTAMGLVQAFPAERGRLEVAKLVASGSMQALFGTQR